MSYEKLNKQIIELIGGRENLEAAAHCVTRLRLTLKDRQKADVEAIKALDGVIDVVSNDLAFQIIIGTHVTDVYREFMVMAGMTSGNEGTESQKLSVKQVPAAILSVVSESMTSIVEVLIAAGMIAGFLSLLAITGVVSAESPTYQIFETLKSSVFTFLPVFLAASSAKRLNVNPYVAMVLATTVMSGNIDGVEGLSMFGFNLPAIEYANTFIPILLGVWLLSLVSKQVEKVIPRSIQMFFVPAISLMLVLPILLFAFGPIGMWIGNGLNWFFNTLAENIGYWIAMMFYAAFQPFLIVLGAANFTFPLMVNFFADLGYDPIFVAAATISDIAVCGAMIGYFLKAKDKKEKNMFGSIGFSAVMGVTEPAVFGVFLKYRRPFIAVIVGGGLGGLLAGLTGVKGMTMAWGLAGLPAFLAGGTWNFIWMLLSSILAFTVAAAVSYGLGIPHDDEDEKVDAVVKSEQPLREQVILTRVSTGQIVDLKEVPDRAFASEALGKGLGVIPNVEKGDVLSPVTGEVTVVFPTKHAYGIQTTEGVEILIHIGVDTVNLQGKGFESHVSVGDKVQPGDVLATVDYGIVRENNFDPTIIVVITNTADYLDVVRLSDEEDNQTLAVII